MPVVRPCFFAVLSLAPLLARDLDPSRLDVLRADLASRGTAALIVMHRDRAVLEWYADGHSASRLQGTASLAKAIVGGMSLMTAIHDGKLSPDDPAARFIPAWRDDPRKSRITIRHLATHSSGIEDAEQDGLPHEKLPGWKGAFWRRDPDPFSIALLNAPVIFEPGAQFHYSNPGMAALAYVVTAATGKDLKALLAERVYRPAGIRDDEWSIGYGTAYRVNGLDLYANWGGGRLTPRATARIGQLMLKQGEAIFPPALVRLMTSYAGTALPERTPSTPEPASGLCWWTNFDGVWPRIPRDAFAGAGAGQELLLVVPSLDLVVVRYGTYLTPAGAKEFWKGAVEHVFNPVIVALGAPYPPSSVIKNVRFAPVESIARDATDSDNWPITWGDDDRLYTAYGDGWGFTPRTDKKLSLGFAAVEGPPEKFRGINIRSETGERTGQGSEGLKASGLIMVDGVLYMWARNAGNAQLAWSSDRAKTWQWGFQFTESFGSPSFLNFGRNNRGARDAYVYTYSQDGPSAYAPSDRIILARVPKSSIKDRAAWEFFTGLDTAGRPKWSPRLEDRQGVFEFPGRSERVDAVYNPGLRRYLLALGYDHAGGWGLYDAPEPWGPWTTVFHTDDWGLGGTHGYRLPSKWIGDNGRTLHLVFSGSTGKGLHYDAFCVRRIDFDLAPRSSQR